MLVRPRHGLPLRDLHRRVIDARRSVRAVNERVLQVIRVVPRREIRAAVSAPRLPSVQRTVGDRGGDVEHEVEFQDPGHLRVEHAVLVRQTHGGESVPQFGDLSARVGEAGLVPEDPDVALHELLHLHAHSGEGLLPSFTTHEPVEHAGLLPPEGFSRRGSAGIGDSLLRVLGRGEAAPLTEHEALAQAVRSEAVRAVNRYARGLPDRVQAGKGRLPGRVRGHPAHDVVLARTHGDRLVNRIESHVLLGEFADHGQLLVDRRGPEGTQVEAEGRPGRTLQSAAPFDLLGHPSREEVPPRPHPPVARIVAFPLIATRRPPRRSMAMTPAHTPPSTIRLVTKYSSNRWMFSNFIDVWKSVCRMWKPTLSAAKTVRLTDMPPKARWLTRPSGSRDQGQPQWSSWTISFGHRATKNSTASWSARKSDPLIVSRACSSRES